VHLRRAKANNGGKACGGKAERTAGRKDKERTAREDEDNARPRIMRLGNKRSLQKTNVSPCAWIVTTNGGETPTSITKKVYRGGKLRKNALAKTEKRRKEASRTPWRPKGCKPREFRRNNRYEKKMEREGRRKNIPRWVKKLESPLHR